MSYRRTIIVAAACLITTAPALAQPREIPDLADRINRVEKDAESFEHFYTIRWSDTAIARREGFFTGQLDSLAAADWAKGTAHAPLSPAARVDALLLRNDLRARLAAARLEQRQLAEMASLLAVGNVVTPLEEARWRLEPADPRAAARLLAQVPSLAKTARETVEKSKPAPHVAQRAAAALADYGRTLRQWYDHSAGFVPDFTWWCAKPHEEAARAIDELARYLREDAAGLRGKPEDPLVGDPIGREALLNALEVEFIALTPEQLLDLADREMAWCTGQAKSAAEEMGCTDAKGEGDWKAALAKVKEDTADPGQQAAYVVGVAREAIEFVKARDGGLVTIPPLCEQLWKSAMLSPQTQRTLPFAVYFPQAIGIAAPSEMMSNEDKLMAMRGNNRRFTRIVVPHELIPGHHLQGFMADREKPYRRRFSTPFLVEGWALYWEMKLWDLGWARSPQDRIGMLFWRMHRCARITVSLKFHLGQMTPQQMIDFLCDNVGHERANATAEVRRYIGGDYSPLYQCGYMVGGKQLRALHAELVPARLNEKQFNDAVLGCGPIPIELIRAELTQTPLSLDSEPSWRFDLPGQP
ncbi:MAG: DUF885 domain-containing protein [Phycisphaerales bacterium]|nr:DUF885 domain-containing protein [Phycisphaerales bacterium]